jgi:hypothetical protein
MTPPPQATPRDIKRNVAEDRGYLRLYIDNLEKRINRMQQSNATQRLATWIIFAWLAVLTIVAAR